MMNWRCVGLRRVSLEHKPSVTRYTHIATVERQRVRSTLGATPERLATVRYSILRETEQQLTDGIIVLFLELQPSPNDALLKGDGPILDQK